MPDQGLKQVTEQLRFIANSLQAQAEAEASEEQNRLLASINQKLAALVAKG